MVGVEADSSTGLTFNLSGHLSGNLYQTERVDLGLKVPDEPEGGRIGRGRDPSAVMGRWVSSTWMGGGGSLVEQVDLQRSRLAVINKLDKQNSKIVPKPKRHR